MAEDVLEIRENGFLPHGNEYTRGPRDHRMRKDSLIRVSAVVLAVLTAATIAFAVINFQKENQFSSPEDGAWWKESNGVLTAQWLTPGGPADKAGIKVGDKLLSVRSSSAEEEHPVASFAAFQKQLYRVGVWQKAVYGLDRNGSKAEASVILVPADRSLYLGLRLIALIYLGIGIYVLLRRWTAPKSTHFYVFCLVSFVLYSFHYTGKLNTFDWIIFWANTAAWMLQPALFLHFALVFPEKRKLLARYPLLAALVYLPGLLLLSLEIFVMQQFEASESLRFNLDRIHWTYLALYFILASIVLWDSYRTANTPLQREQMKWISRGTVLAIAPFTLLYVVPYLAGFRATPLMKISVLSLGISSTHIRLRHCALSPDGCGPDL